jgi:ribosome-interacting GTPase 1
VSVVCFVVVGQLWAHLLKSAIVWGASAKHARGQKVGLDHILEDEDGMLTHAEYFNPA